mgnify:CR=1 FL=1
MNNNNLLSTAEVKKQTSLSNTTLWRKTKDGTFPLPVYLGNKKLWHQYQIDDWLSENLKTEPTHNNLIPKVQVAA